MNDYKTVKIALVGSAAIGKTSLARMLAKQGMDSGYISTVGADLKFVYDHSKRMKIAVWDLAGQQRLRTITSSYVGISKIIAFCYDANDKRTFYEMRTLYKELKEKKFLNDQQLLVIATKIDLVVDSEYEAYGRLFSEQIGGVFFKTSSKQDVGREVIVNHILRDIQPLQIVQFSDKVDIKYIGRNREEWCEWCVLI